MTTDVGADALIRAGGALALAGKQIGLLSGTVLGVNSPDVGVDASNAIVLQAGSGITLACGSNFITINSGGVFIKGSTVFINSGGAALGLPALESGSTTSPDAPGGALQPGETKATENPAGSTPGGENTHDENAEENKDKTHWIEVELKDESGAPVIGESCEITLPNGKKATKSTDKNGLIRVNKIDPGNCTVRWIDLDQEAVSQ
jgi:type VI secretion system secreted protein VgrG